MRNLIARLAVALGAAAWGLFWIPLRILDQNGIRGAWAIALIMLLAAFGASLLLWFRRWFAPATHARHRRSDRNLLVGASFGLSILCYCLGLLFSDIVRVVLLFYLLPVWTTLAEWLVRRQAIGARRITCIGFCLCGLWLLMGGDFSGPAFGTAGDWFALLAGMLWAFGLVIVSYNRAADQTKTVDALQIMALTFWWAFVLAMLCGFVVNAMALLPDAEPPALFHLGVQWVHVVVATLILLPAMMGQVWGARFISAQAASLLTMSELVSATLSAALLIGIGLDRTGWVGAVIIILAVLADQFSRGDQSRFAGKKA